MEVERIELSTHACKAHVFPLAPHPQIGSTGWVRTTDQMINSHLLYRLSYCGINNNMPDNKNNYTQLYKLGESTNKKYWTTNRVFKKTYDKIEKQYIQEELLEKKEFILDNTWRSQGESNS